MQAVLQLCGFNATTVHCSAVLSMLGAFYERLSAVAKQQGALMARGPGRSSPMALRPAGAGKAARYDCPPACP